MGNQQQDTVHDDEAGVLCDCDHCAIVCPRCHARNPRIECGKTPGFTGAPIYWATFQCCGYQDIDESRDALAAVR
jgi:hypothetical protein